MDKTKKYKGTHLLSFLRNGNFAHTGEEEAINLVMQKFPRDNDQLILDVGCGLGGTANFIQSNGWGKVIGIDREPELIEYAKSCYPNIDFHTCEIINIDKLFTIALFDVTCLFNVYYSLGNPRLALQALQKVTKQTGHIAIFDYLDLCKNQLNPLFQEGNSKTKPFYPIKKEEIENLLSMTGWTTHEIIDISDKYATWHTNLFNKLVSNKEIIVQKFGQQEYEQYHDTYNNILDTIQKGMLGGAIIYAAKK